jgi:hypothetical protein
VTGIWERLDDTVKARWVMLTIEREITLVVLGGITLIVRMEIREVSYDLLLKGMIVHWGTAVVKRAINFLIGCSTEQILVREMRKGITGEGHSFTLTIIANPVLIVAHLHLMLVYRTPRIGCLLRPAVHELVSSTHRRANRSTSPDR